MNNHAHPHTHLGVKVHDTRRRICGPSQDGRPVGRSRRPSSDAVKDVPHAAARHVSREELDAALARAGGVVKHHAQQWHDVVVVTAPQRSHT